MGIPGEYKQRRKSSKPSASATTERDRDWGGKGEFELAHPVCNQMKHIFEGASSAVADQTNPCQVQVTRSSCEKSQPSQKLDNSIVKKEQVPTFPHK